MEQQVDQLIKQMHERVVDFSYEKVDGSIRQASGTLMADAIESFIGPSKGTSNKTPNPDVLVYFDVGAQAFRSFRKDKFLCIND